MRRLDEANKIAQQFDTAEFMNQILDFLAVRIDKPLTSNARDTKALTADRRRHAASTWLGVLGKVNTASAKGLKQLRRQREA
jgi:hypothetical protein